MIERIERILFILIFIIFGFIALHIVSLSNRIEKIENKLGGSKKISCNEKDTVERVRRSVVRIVGGASEGSGFAIQKGGFILTNFHVIDTEPAPKVVLPDNTFETGEVIMADEAFDLAVIKIKADLPAIKFARLNKIYPAEEFLAIGYPLGGDMPGSESFVIRGAFSRCTKDKKNLVQYILTDMTLIPGISGGPMVNICGEVVGINTAGLSQGGVGIAISSDSIIDKLGKVSTAKDPLKDVHKINFEPNKNALEAVRCFYNYLKARRMEKAFELLSDNFVQGYSFEYWARGYRPMLDTSVVMIKPDKKVANRIFIKLSTKDLVDDEIVYKFFEGYWDVKQVNGRWQLWSPKIKQVEEPGMEWFMDMEIIKEIEKFVKARKASEECGPQMYQILQEPGNENLSLQELYDLAIGIKK
ncbi:MAG: trypsin-like peptidase domain-containing protein [Candidatus Omnitrophota bacterium]